MKILITGAGGQLGSDCVLEALHRGHDVTGTVRNMSAGGRIDENTDIAGLPDSSAKEKERGITALTGDDPAGQVVGKASYVSLDITDRGAVDRVIGQIKPDAIIHCAAWTAVEAAEEETNQAVVQAVNAYGTRFIAEAAKKNGCRMLYISTDYVFDGKGERPWQPEDVPVKPVNFYGLTKLEGEQAVMSVLDKYFIVRVAWAFGPNGKNFIKTMIEVGKTHDRVRVVDDQIGTPTFTPDLARLLVDMVESEKYGVYHATNSECEPGGYISWADLAEEAYRAASMNVTVDRVSTKDYGVSAADRPRNSRLAKDKLLTAGFTPLPDWKDAVRRYIEKL